MSADLDMEQPDPNAAAPGPAGVPSAALQQARREVKETAQAAAQAAAQLEQLAMFTEPAFEEAMCLTPEEVKKRYTAKNAQQIEWRREACIKLLARQCATEDICDILKMNHRTVAAIAAQEGQKIAAFSNEQSEVLAADAMTDIAVARTKREGASFKDLHIAAGIKLTHAVALKMVAAGGGDEAEATEVEAQNPALESARKFLEARKPKPQMDTDETQIKPEEGK